MASIQAGVNDIDDLDDRRTGGKAEAVAEIRNLQVGFRTDQGSFNVLDGVSFTVRSGRTLCLVGESGRQLAPAPLLLRRRTTGR